MYAIHTNKKCLYIKFDDDDDDDDDDDRRRRRLIIYHYNRVRI